MSTPEKPKPIGVNPHVLMKKITDKVSILSDSPSNFLARRCGLLVFDEQLQRRISAHIKFDNKGVMEILEPKLIPATDEFPKTITGLVRQKKYPEQVIIMDNHTLNELMDISIMVGGHDHPTQSTHLLKKPNGVAIPVYHLRDKNFHTPC